VPWANDGGASLNSTKCVPVVANPDLPGETCTAEDYGLSGVDTCDFGAVCVNVDYETGEGYCVSQCVGPYECPAPGFHCQVVSSGVENFCFPACDPVLQDCAEGLSCRPSLQGDFVCLWYWSGDGGGYGASCEYPNQCDPGLYCMNSEYIEGCQAAGCCTPWCDTTKPNTCPGATQECIPWYEEGMGPPGFENVGICGIPQ